MASQLILKTLAAILEAFPSLVKVDKGLTTLYMSSKSTQGINLSQGGRHE